MDSYGFIKRSARLPPLGRGISVKRHRARSAIASTGDGGLEGIDSDSLGMLMIDQH